MYVGQIKKDKGRGGTSCVLGEGEPHETSTEQGLTAIVMEAENLEQGIVMPIIPGELWKMIIKANQEDTNEILKHTAQALLKGREEIVN